MNHRQRAWLLILLVAVICAASVGVSVWRRGRPVSDSAMLQRLPYSDAMVLYVDFAALRQNGMLTRIFGSRAVEDADYRKFVEQTGFNFREDLDLAVMTFGPTGKYAVVRGSFDWKKLRTYVEDQRGDCALSLCRMKGSTPERRISFRPLQNRLMALAISPDDSAVRRMDVAVSGEDAVLPPAPVWLRIPGSALKSGDQLPTGTKMFARSLEQASGLLVMLGSEGNRLAARIDVECRSAQEAADVAASLGQATSRLRQMLELEHQKPNPADLSGLLASGEFRAEGNHARGRWIIEDAFLDNVLGGSLN